jgi:hypothetical protein
MAALCIGYISLTALGNMGSSHPEITIAMYAISQAYVALCFSTFLFISPPQRFSTRGRALQYSCIAAASVLGGVVIRISLGLSTLLASSLRPTFGLIAGFTFFALCLCILYFKWFWPIPLNQGNTWVRFWRVERSPPVWEGIDVHYQERELPDHRLEMRERGHVLDLWDSGFSPRRRRSM